MSDAPTHTTVPTPARQQADRASQTERVQNERAQTERGQGDHTQQVDRSQLTERAQQAERHAESTQHDDRAPQHLAQSHQAQSHQASSHEARAHDAEARQTQSRQSQDAGQRQAGRLEDEWQAVQYDFVDDPKAAVRKADALVKRALEDLTKRHRSLTEQLEGNSDPQTEDLRLALHRYRELFKSLVAVK
ncbi:hypothetical protein SAMN05216188_104386 [Lentzea xinjiangensis]|uniref:Uncharacterized protein n=1 Tax=Lentzea xinjiangensis TaxID=402600 RepID=A0A1H9I823_9PSEU|nr:hypothetical protein [Lentzea xinjiangensis]SEQ70696.1 hypothetical protein SAMN05216188_104386 [Lentzea xinjiangensis]